MIIDSHQHFWNYHPSTHAWIDSSMAAIARDFKPADLEQVYAQSEVEGCVAVQAAQTEQETVMLLHYAQQYDIIKGVVGWLDLCANDINNKLEHYTQNDFFKGLRHIVQDEEDDFFMLRDDFQQGISQLQRFDLTYDLLIYPKQFEAAIALTQNFPDQYFVLDHLGKPQYNLPMDMHWAEQIEQLADQPKVYCKLSGIFTEIQTKPWQVEQILPYLDHVVRCFGMDRLLYGSDWPVCLLASNFKDHLDLLNSYFSLSDQKDIEKVFATNCIHFYDL